MIPNPSITAWSVARPWPNRAAVEQDLLLARLIVEIYNHPRLSEELYRRGVGRGTGGRHVPPRTTRTSESRGWL